MDPEQVRHVARLARLDLSENEVRIMAGIMTSEDQPTTSSAWRYFMRLPRMNPTPNHTASARLMAIGGNFSKVSGSMKSKAETSAKNPAAVRRADAGRRSAPPKRSYLRRQRWMIRSRIRLRPSTVI